MDASVNYPSAISTKSSAVKCADADTPIFLTGFARSGTTWINRLLRDYFDAGFVNEGQFIVSFGRRLARYGDLGLDQNRERLIRDLRGDPFFQILARNYSVEIDWHRTRSVAPTFAAIVLDVLQQIADQTGKHRIGSKYPVFGRYLGLLDRHFPHCKVVHVIRDGRDCALSHRHVTWGHQNTYAAAVHWRNYLRDARDGARHMSARYLELRYEDLIDKPEPTMARLEEFLTGISGPVTERFIADAKLLKPEKIAHWRQAMSVRSQAIFEGVAGDALREEGYPLTGVAHLPSLPMRGLYVAHDRLTREGWHWARKVFPGISEYK